MSESISEAGAVRRFPELQSVVDVRQAGWNFRPITDDPVRLRRAYDQEIGEVRGRAAEVLAAVGSGKLRRISLFRACRCADLAQAVDNYEHDPYLADLAWIRAAEWLRIWLFLPADDSET